MVYSHFFTSKLAKNGYLVFTKSRMNILFRKKILFVLFFVGLCLLGIGLLFSTKNTDPSSAQRGSSAFSYPSPTPTISEKEYPADLIDLQNWKLTIPLGNSEKPTEIRQPSLNTYVLDPWFVLHPEKTAIIFRAPVSAVTTKGSNYPRSELREMTNNGQTNASWSSTVGRHTMTVEQAITAVPKTKQHVVAGQIHDADDDIIVIRLEYPNLYINVDGKNVYTLDSNYTLGKRFQFSFDVANGKTSVYYNNSSKPVYTLTQTYRGAYFKAGVYTQSNCSKEKSTDCTPQNLGEVILYGVTVTHQ